METFRLEFGPLIKEEQHRHLATLSAEEYGSAVQRVRSSDLIFNPVDLEQDWRDHAGEFGEDAFASEEEYAQEAREVVRESQRVLVHIRKEQLQFLFFGDRGYAVADHDGMIRGYYGHPEKGAIDKAFEALRAFKLWLQIQ